MSIVHLLTWYHAHAHWNLIRISYSTSVISVFSIRSILRFCVWEPIYADSWLIYNTQLSIIKTADDFLLVGHLCITYIYFWGASWWDFDFPALRPSVMWRTVAQISCYFPPGRFACFSLFSLRRCHLNFFCVHIRTMFLQAFPDFFQRIWTVFIYNRIYEVQYTV
jgi:hypothetical protein